MGTDMELIASVTGGSVVAHSRKQLLIDGRVTPQ